MGIKGGRIFEDAGRGRYATQRDGTVYTYELIYETVGRGCRWEATVKLDGRVVGQLEREILDCYGLDPFSLASAQLHYAIEHSVDLGRQSAVRKKDSGVRSSPGK